MDYRHDRTVCIIGLGYVGLTLAIIMAEAGYTVWGVEINRTSRTRSSPARRISSNRAWTSGWIISFGPGVCWW